MFALQLIAAGSGRICRPEATKKTTKNTNKEINMPLSTHRARELIRALQGMENDLRLLRNEVEDSLVRNERRIFFHVGMQVRISDHVPLVMNKLSFFWWNSRVGTIRSFDFNDGTVTLWLCSVNSVECLLNVSVHAVEEVEYDSTGEGAYPSDWDSEDAI